jgi:hypothetical protein
MPGTRASRAALGTGVDGCGVHRVAERKKLLIRDGKKKLRVFKCLRAV